MKTIVLPGYSPRNRDWANDVRDKVDVCGGVVVIEWEHWNPSVRSTLSIKRELERIKKVVGKDKINIIAKSVGTRLAMHLLTNNQIRIEKLILCGIPTKGDDELVLGNITVDESKNIYARGLRLIKPKSVIVFQNKKDPFASFDDINKFVGRINPKIKIFEKERSDHDYPYFEDFSDFLS